MRYLKIKQKHILKFLCFQNFNCLVLLLVLGFAPSWYTFNQELMFIETIEFFALHQCVHWNPDVLSWNKHVVRDGVHIEEVQRFWSCCAQVNSVNSFFSSELQLWGTLPSKQYLMEEVLLWFSTLLLNLCAIVFFFFFIALLLL